jgi:hypothetical protein
MVVGPHVPAQSWRVGAPATIAEVARRVNGEAIRWWFEPASTRYRPDAYGARFSNTSSLGRCWTGASMTARSARRP